MDSIQVGCAIIHHRGEILIAQRKPDDHLGGYWEFPGGKIEKCETVEACLIREAEEELGILIEPHQLLLKTTHAYPTRLIHLNFYLCRWKNGEPQKKDVADFRWVKPEELRNFQFPPADKEMIEDLIRNQLLYFN